MTGPIPQSNATTSPPVAESHTLSAPSCDAVISDYEWLVQNAQRGMPQATCRPLWEELFAAAAGKDVEYAWKKRDQSLGSRLAHQLARDAAKAK